MATPTQQRSRYPRPLKATHSFPNTNATVTPGIPGQPVTSINSTGTVTSPVLVVTAAVNVSRNGGVSPPSGNGGKRNCSSPERRSPVSTSNGGQEQDDGGNPRRSNSLGSLSDPDCYMNSLWPRVNPSYQSDAEGTMDATNSLEENFHEFSHKRSNSCSSADRLKKIPPLKNGHASSVHTRTSVEGLNQEISSALEGKCFSLDYHPDGHVAPIRDLLTDVNMETQTPPLSLGLSHSCPSSQTPSPYPIHTSPTITLSQIITVDQADINTGTSNNIAMRESPATPDTPHGSSHPSSPKPSFAREPPDGAERCIIIQDTRLYSGDYVPKGPDKSKGNIVFKGSVFAPLLPTPSLKSVPSSQVPVNSLQC